MLGAYGPMEETAPRPTERALSRAPARDEHELTALSNRIKRSGSARYWGQVAFGSVLMIGCPGVVGTIGRKYGLPAFLWQE
jgi:hypothetical protein